MPLWHTIPMTGHSGRVNKHTRDIYRCITSTMFLQVFDV